MAGKILITGATSPLGRKILQHLFHWGAGLRAAVHNRRKEEYVKMPHVQIAYLDFTDMATIDRALEGIETLFLFTPVAREQVEYTRRMVDRARLWGVSYIVKLSMMGVDDSPGIQFTRLHKESELYIQNSAIPYTFIRPNAFMQNFLTTFQPNGSFLYLPMNHARVSYVDLRDVGRFCAEIVMNAKKFQGSVFELTGPSALAPEEVTTAITDSVKHHISYINVPKATAQHLLESAGKPHWLAKGWVEFCTLQRSGRLSGVQNTFEQITGTKRHTFEQFVLDYRTIFTMLVQQEHHTFLR